MSSTGFLRHIDHCTNHDLSRFLPFFIDGHPVGWVRRELAGLLGAQEGFVVTAEGLSLNGRGLLLSERTHTLAHAAKAIADHYQMTLDGEIYPVIQKWGDEPLAHIDRLAIPWFGVRGYGVHVNGFVRKPEGFYLWIGERAQDRRVDPGKLDNMIGGGLPLGLTIEENLYKEAWEEAGLDRASMKAAQHVTTIRYKSERMRGLADGTLFVFDIELPEGTVPQNTDGEVESFTLMRAEEVAEIIRTTDRFKFNCNLVLIDFLIRHGLIGPDHAEHTVLCEALAPLKSNEGL